MAKAAASATASEAPTVEAIESRRPGAPICPKVEAHPNTQVYKTKGSVQYCKCNDCGELWSRPRPTETNVATDVMISLADTLDSAPQVQHGSQLVIMVPIDDAKRISRRIREICQQA